MRAFAGRYGCHDFVIVRADNRHVVRHRIRHIGETALRIEGDVPWSQPDLHFTDDRVIPAIDHRDRVRSRSWVDRPSGCPAKRQCRAARCRPATLRETRRRRRARSHLGPDRWANKLRSIRRDARKQRTPSRRSRREHLIVRCVDDRDIVRAAVGNVQSRCHREKVPNAMAHRRSECVFSPAASKRR